MPLIADRKRRKRVPINEEILANVHEEIVEYCEWAGITDFGYFFEEAAKFIFANDPLWQEFLLEKQNKNT
jgi:hypothetical protein